MSAVAAALEATWPAAAVHRAGPWAVREGRGGGRRVSCATAEGDWTAADIALAEAAQAALGQPSLFMLRAGETALDAALEAAGYAVEEPVRLWSGAIAALAVEPPPLTAFTIWPPMEIQRAIWAGGGIGPARLAVMERAPAPKAAILARAGDRPCGAAFACVHGGIAVVHALHVAPAFRRRGAARAMMGRAAVWAQAQGAEELALAVTAANTAAGRLYASLGMAIVGQCHYRRKTPPEA